MRFSRSVIVMVFVISVFSIAVPVFSQDAATTAAPVQESPAPVVTPETSSQIKEIAIYGEVQAVDGASGSLAVQYYDYDSDSEKTADIAVSATTKLENVAAVGEIKKGDWVDVTYSVVDSKNAAKVVTVEKEEAPVPEEDVAPQASAAANVPVE